MGKATLSGGNPRPQAYQLTNQAIGDTRVQEEPNDNTFAARLLDAPLRLTNEASMLYTHCTVCLPTSRISAHRKLPNLFSQYGSDETILLYTTGFTPRTPRVVQEFQF